MVYEFENIWGKLRNGGLIFGDPLVNVNAATKPALPIEVEQLQTIPFLTLKKTFIEIT